jgi:YD repeat-containing protein
MDAMAAVMDRPERKWDLSEYVDGDVAENDRARVEEHVGVCPECRRLLASPRGTLAALMGLRENGPQPRRGRHHRAVPRRGMTTEGERWARDQLLALRAAGYRPTAALRFLAASLERAAAIRRTRPALARQSRRWALAGLAGGSRACHAARRAGLPAPRTATWAAWWIACAAMLDWHLGMLEAPDGAERERLGAGDAASLARIALVPFAAAAPPRRRPFAALLAIAATTDAADGPLARRSGPTRLGRDLDTVGDALVGLAAGRSARRAGWLAPRAAHLVVARHAAPIAFTALAYFAHGRRSAHATRASTRWAAPAILGGMMLSPWRHRAGNLLAATGAAAALTSQTAGCGVHPGPPGAGMLLPRSASAYHLQPG